ncbi:MAG: cobalamin-binding protein [Firmicutes bacterium]|nr:cobalamin-binding protein [Bacillota bacterium]
MKLARSRYIAWLGLLIMVVAINLTGCQKTADLKSNNDQAAGQLAVFPMVITDDLGRQVNLPAAPQRIVSLAPSNTEIVYFLGIGDRLVGDTDYCDYPEEAKLVTKVGGFKDPSIEKIVSLKPDLVLATDMHEQMLTSMNAAGLRVIVLKPDTIEETLTGIQMIGRATGVESKALALTAGLRDRVNLVSQKVAAVPQAQRPTVYHEIWYEPYMTVGKDSMIGQIIKMAGGINIAEDIVQQYPQLSEEVIIAKNPQVMFNSYGMDSKVITAAEISARSGWQDIAFVKSGRIYTIESDYLTIAGPRIVIGLEKMAAYLHPELFK